MNRRQAFTLALSCIGLPTGRAQGAPAPNAALAAVQGTWRGQLTYRDYSRPDRLVTLPTRLHVALLGPTELALHYVFDDGPGKTVYSYERMAFDFENKSLAWTSGWSVPKTSQHRITHVQDAGQAITFERDGENAVINRYALRLAPQSLSLAKEEGRAAAGFQFRNRYEFSRSAPDGDPR